MCLQVLLYLLLRMYLPKIKSFEERNRLTHPVLATFAILLQIARFIALKRPVLATLATRWESGGVRATDMAISKPDGESRQHSLSRGRLPDPRSQEAHPVYVRNLGF